MITATSKASLQKSLGDAEDTQVLDTTKFAFGRYYKFDIVATVKERRNWWGRYRKYCNTNRSPIRSNKANQL